MGLRVNLKDSRDRIQNIGFNAVYNTPPPCFKMAAMAVPLMTKYGRAINHLWRNMDEYSKICHFFHPNSVMFSNRNYRKNINFTPLKPNSAQRKRYSVYCRSSALGDEFNYCHEKYVWKRTSFSARLKKVAISVRPKTCEF